MKYCTTCRRITEHYLFGSELLCTVCLDDVPGIHKLLHKASSDIIA